MNLQVMLIYFTLISFLLIKSIDSKKCDINWSSIEGKCVKYSTEKSTFHEAIAMCKNSSGRLIEIHNFQAGKIVAQLAATAFGVTHPDFWIGIDDQQNHGL